jgi:hypothetical protein
VCDEPDLESLQDQYFAVGFVELENRAHRRYVRAEQLTLEVSAGWIAGGRLRILCAISPYGNCDCEAVAAIPAKLMEWEWVSGG